MAGEPAARRPGKKPHADISGKLEAENIWVSHLWRDKWQSTEKSPVPLISGSDTNGSKQVRWHLPLRNWFLWSVTPFLSHREISSFHKWLHQHLFCLSSDSHERPSHKLTLNVINESLLFWLSVSDTLSVKHSNPCYSTFQNQIKTCIPLYLFHLLR